MALTPALIDDSTNADDSDSTEHDGIDFKTLEDELYDQEISHILTDPHGDSIREIHSIKDRNIEMGILNTPEVDLDNIISKSEELQGRTEAKEPKNNRDTLSNEDMGLPVINSQIQKPVVEGTESKMDDCEHNSSCSSDSDDGDRSSVENDGKGDMSEVNSPDKAAFISGHEALCDSEEDCIHKGTANQNTASLIEPIIDTDKDDDVYENRTTNVLWRNKTANTNKCQSADDSYDDTTEDMDDEDDDDDVNDERIDETYKTNEESMDNDSCKSQTVQEENNENVEEHLKIKSVTSGDADSSIVTGERTENDGNDVINSQQHREGDESKADNMDNIYSDIDDEGNTDKSYFDDENTAEPALLVKNVFSLSESRACFEGSEYEQEMQMVSPEPHSPIYINKVTEESTFPQSSASNSDESFYQYDQQSESGHQQSESSYQQSESGYQQSESGHQKSESGYQQSESSYQQSESGVTGLDVNTNYLDVKVKEEPPDSGEYGYNSEYANHSNHSNDPGNNTLQDSGHWNEEDHGFEIPRDIEYDTLIPEENGEFSKTIEDNFLYTENGQYKCKYCSCRMNDYLDFRRHVWKFHNKQYTCKHCGENFLRSQALAIHVRVRHMLHLEEKKKAKKKPVTACKKENLYIVRNKDNKIKILEKSKSRRLSTSKVILDTGECKYKCAYCSDLFDKQQTMACHVRNVHILPNDECKVVQKALKKNDDKHLIEKESPKIATFIPKSKARSTKASRAAEDESKEIAQMQEDFNIHIEPKVFQCDYCPKWFFKRAEFGNHMAKHEKNNFKDIKKEEISEEEGNQLDYEERKIVSFCKYCPSKFESVKKLKIHVIKHLGEVFRTDEECTRNLTCSICGLILPSTVLMRQHLKKHPHLAIEKMDPFDLLECTYCGQPFLAMENFKEHMKMHTNYKKSKDILKAAKQAASKQKSVISKNSKSSVRKSLEIKDVKVPKMEKSFEGSNISSDLKLDKEEGQMLKKDNSSESDKVSSKVELSSQEVQPVCKHLSVIPFECGMCKSRFPSSQFLLHHMTLHMKGKFVFKIEQDKPESVNVKEEPPSPEKQVVSPRKHASILIPKVTTFSQRKGVSEKTPTSMIPMVPGSVSVGDKIKCSPGNSNLVLKPLVIPNPQTGINKDGATPTIKTFIVKTSNNPGTTNTTTLLVPSTSQMSSQPPATNSLILNKSHGSNSVQYVNLLPQSVVNVMMPQGPNTSSLSATKTPVTVLSSSKSHAPILSSGKPLVSLMKDRVYPQVMTLTKLNTSTAKNTQTNSKVNLSRMPASLLPPASSRVFQISNNKNVKVSVNTPLVTSTTTKKTRSLLTSVVREKLKDKIASKIDTQGVVKEKDRSRKRNKKQAVKIREEMSSSETDEDMVFNSSSDSLDEENSSVSGDENSGDDSAGEWTRDPDYPSSEQKKILGKRRRTNTPHKKERMQTYKRKLCFVDGSWFECSMCMYQTSFLKEYKQHMEQHNKLKMEDLVPCNVCNKQFTSKYHLEKHKSQHRASEYQCSVCQLGFSTSSDVVNHIAKEHSTNT